MLRKCGRILLTMSTLRSSLAFDDNPIFYSASLRSVRRYDECPGGN
jgi:hypothetical protein